MFLLTLAFDQDWDLRCNSLVGGALAVVVGGVAGVDLVGLGAQAALDDVVGIAGAGGARRCRGGIGGGLNGSLGRDANGEKGERKELHACGFGESGRK